LSPKRPGRTSAVNPLGQNRLLQLLPTAERERVLAHCKNGTIPRPTVLYEAGSEIREVYFPVSGMVSLVITSEEGQTVEIGTVGNEGLLGTQIALGAERSHVEAIVQVSGEFLRLPRDDFESELKNGGILRTVVARFAQAITNQIAQSVLCNRIHSVDERLCRWFLMTHDRVGTDDIMLTQQFIAQMLGVRRPSVTVAAGMLQKAGLITYSRGKLTIVDRAGLEAGACECYEIVRQETTRLLAG
jgi:CRP-like cAMP-binding protein